MSEQTKPIILFTPSAVEYLREMADKHGPKAGFRLSVEESGCSGFAYESDIVDAPQDNDLNFEQDGLNIYIDPNCVEFVQGTIIDFISKGLGQTQLLFKNPNITGACGCGESFSVDEQEKQGE